MKKLAKAGVVIVVLYLAALGALLAVMRRPVLLGKVMRHVPEPAFFVVPFKHLWFLARKGNLRLGDVAPDFSLPTSDKKASAKLSSLRGQKPVVLIFGSYT